MKKTAHPLTTAIAILTAILLGGGPARAQEKPIPGSGTLDAIGPGGKPLGACPLQHTDVAVEISGFVARVTVTQVFASRFTEPVEAIYTFPLSDRAAVDAMSMRTGERTIRGEIKRREEARRIYEAARNAGQVAALLDQERPNIFTQTLANLMPGATVEIRIEYVEPLVFRDGTFEFSFPTVVGPRFIPGAPTGHAGTGWAPDTTRVPDASRITPPVTPEGTRAGHDIAIAVDIDAGVPILDVVSPLHAIDVERPEANQARVRLRDQAEIPNRDFVLRYAVAGDEVRSGYLAHRDGEGEGYVTFVLLPPKRVTAETAAPKEMIFVIDRSGSQAGLPLEKAKETMRWILDHMNPNDTFQVVDFGNTANVLFPTPQPASPEMKRQARAHIDALEANGGTMMAEAVRTV
ncbi:MAG: VWA domain-containing protein, partial [Deltaproteobacteria bacterium]